MQLVQKAKPRFMEGHSDGQGEPYGKYMLLKEKHIHKMHIAIRPIARAFENLQKCFLKANDDLITLKKPLHCKNGKMGEEQHNQLI
jgi:hypothetical protein